MSYTLEPIGSITFPSTVIGVPVTCWLTETTVLVFNRQGYYSVGTVSADNSISWTTPAYTAVSGKPCSAIRVSDTKFILLQEGGASANYVQALEWNGTTLSKGTAVNMAGADQDLLEACLIDSSKFIVCFCGYTYLTVNVCSLSGLVITKGTDVASTTLRPVTGAGYGRASMTKISDSTFVIGGKLNSGSYACGVAVVTVSGTTPTINTPVQIDTTNYGTNNITVRAIKDSKIFVTVCGTVIYGYTATVSGTTVNSISSAFEIMDTADHFVRGFVLNNKNLCVLSNREKTTDIKPIISVDNEEEEITLGASYAYYGFASSLSNESDKMLLTFNDNTATKLVYYTIGTVKAGGGFNATKLLTLN